MAVEDTGAEDVGAGEAIAEAGDVFVARPLPGLSPRPWPLPWQKPLPWT